MTQLTINIPDNKLDFFKQLIKELKGATITNELNDDTIFTPEVLKMLDERSKTPLDQYIPAREIYNELKEKYSV